MANDLSKSIPVTKFFYYTSDLQDNLNKDIKLLRTQNMFGSRLTNLKISARSAPPNITILFLTKLKTRINLTTMIQFPKSITTLPVLQKNMTLWTEWGKWK